MGHVSDYHLAVRVKFLRNIRMQRSGVWLTHWNDVDILKATPFGPDLPYTSISRLRKSNPINPAFKTRKRHHLASVNSNNYLEYL